MLLFLTRSINSNILYRRIRRYEKNVILKIITLFSNGYLFLGTYCVTFSINDALRYVNRVMLLNYINDTKS